MFITSQLIRDGNFTAGHSRWETVSPEPRFGTHYVGLRNRIAVLSESYSYAPFKDRVRGSYELVKAIAEQSAENKEQVRRILNDARDRSGAGGKDPMEVILRHRDAPVGRPHELLGYVEKTEAGRHIATSEFKTYEVQYWGGTEATLAVRRPYAYLIPAKYTKVIENLQSHGIKLEKLRTKSELDIEPFRVDKISREAIFQKHLLVTLEGTTRSEKRVIDAGTYLVRTAQPLGSLAVYLLEAQSSDGLATWNFFDDDLKEGKEFPVLRLSTGTASQ